MPELNPLKFAVAIQDEATGKLNDIERKFGELKDKTISVRVEGLDDLRNLLAMLNQKQPSNIGNSVSQEVEKATAALKKEEEELARLKQVAEKNGVGTAIAEDLRKAEAELNDVEAKLRRIASFKAEAEKIINATHKVYDGPIQGSKIYDYPMVRKAYEDDKKEREKIVSDLDKKWDAFWKKQDDEAQRFAIICKKSLESVDMGDFYKHALGANADAAKSWLRTYARDMYGLYFGKDGDLYKDMSMMRGMSRAGAISGEMQEELKVLEALQRKYNDFWKQRSQAEGSSPRYDAAYKQVQADQEAYINAQTRIAAATKLEKELLEQQAAAQQKVNGIKAQSTAEDQKKAQANAAVVAQEQKVAEAKERLTQATQQQGQASQKEAQDIKVTGDAMQRLSEQYQQLAQNSIKTALDAFTQNLRDIKTAIQNDNFTAFAKRIQTCSEAITKLTEAFSAFKVVIGDNKELKDLLSGWGAAIREVSAAIGAMNAAKSASSAKSSAQKENLKQEEQGLVKVADALGKVRAAAGASGANVGVLFMESITRVGERNIQTLIKEQAHIERLIEIAKKSISFGEGHPVLGMGRLRGDQMANLRELEGLKKTISEILFVANQGDQVMIRFLNTLGALRTTPLGKDAMGNDVTLLGGHFDKLVHSVRDTSSAMRQLNNEMRLDSNVWPNAEQQSNLRRYNQMLVDAEKLLRQIDTAGAKGFKLGLDTSLSRVASRDVTAFIEKAMKFEDMGNFRALNELIGQFQRLKTVYGEVAKEQEKMNAAQEKLNASQEKSSKKAAETAARQAERDNQAWAASMDFAKKKANELRLEIEKLEAHQKAGAAMGIDTSELSRQIAILKQNLSTLYGMAGGAKMGGTSQSFVTSASYGIPLSNARAAMNAVKQSVSDEKAYMKEVERFTEQSKKAYEKAERERVAAAEKAERERLSTIKSSEKAIQSELEKTQKLYDKVSDSVNRGRTAGRDMSALESQQSRLLGQKMLLQNMTNADKENVALVESRVRGIREVRNETERLKKSEDELTKARERANTKQDNIAIRRLKEEEKSVNEAYVNYNKLTTIIHHLNTLQARGQRANIDTTAVEQYIALLEREKQLLKEIWSNNGRTTSGNSFGLKAGLLTSEALKDNRIASENIVKKYNSGVFEKALVDAERKMKSAEAAARGLDKKIQDIEARKVDFQGLDTSRLDAAIQRLRLIQAELNNFARTGQSVHGANAFEISKNMGLAAANKEVLNATRQLTDTQRENERVARQNAQAAQQLTADQQRLSQALNQTNEHMRGQSQVLSDLKSLATQYLGVWGGQQFLNNIIQIGGQLEMQRLSIGAILQNQSQANTLFNQIKGLATQSPFGVVELDQMTKQLTAYGFKYHELFDMTKRLADISAATGTSVDRLALALGHVRSEAALSGYTLRQFSMGNVPLLQKLSEKLGKTTKEIRDMVKKKEISYDDVIGVLKDLTDEGGMFYNMQEVISESVKAKFKNVKDAMDIMYGEMAEGGIGEALKLIASGLMEVTRNWKDAATIIGTGTAAWALSRVAVMMYTQTLGVANAQTLASIAAHRRKEAEMLLEAETYRELTAAEVALLEADSALTIGMRARMALGMKLTMNQRRQLLVARQQLVMDLALALSEKKLTTEHILRQVALGKLSHAQARAIIGLADLSAAERQAALSALDGTRKIGMFRMAMLGLGNTIGKTIGKIGKFLFNPAMLFMAGTTAVMELWQRNSREMEKAEELADSIYQHSQDAVRNTRTMMQNELAPLGIVGKDNKELDTADLAFGNIKNAKIKFPEVDKSDMEQVIEEWTNYIENFAVNSGHMLNKAFFDSSDALLPLEQRFENLKEVMNEVVLAQYALRDLGNIFENAVNSSDGGWFDDNVMTDIADYDKTLKKFGSNVASTYRKYMQAVDDGVRAAEKQSSSFADATKDMDTYAQKFSYLVSNQEKFADAWKAFQSVEGTGDAVFNINEALFSTTAGDVNKKKQEMLAELDSFYVQLDAELQTKGVDLNNLTKQQQQALLIGYKKQLESIQGLSEESMRYLMEMFGKHYNIEVNFDDSKFVPKVDEAIRILEDLVGRKWTVEIEASSTVGNVIDEARKKYKQAKEYFEKAKPILIKFGLSAGIGTKLTKDQIDAAVAKAPEMVREALRKALEGWNEMTDVFNNATDASKALGFSLEDEKKNKKKEKKEKKGPAFKDEFAKRWDERIRIMKEAYDWYDKWEKKVGNDEAIKETNDKYADIFKEWRTDKLLPMDFDVKEIADYTRYVEKIRDDALARYQSQKNDKSKNNGQEALRVYRQAVSLLNDVKFDNFNKAAEDFKSIIEKTISDLNARWDIFNTVRGATSNAGLASSIARFGPAESDARTMADAMRFELLRQLRSAGSEGLVTAIPLDVHLDEEGLRKQFENAIPQTENAEKYKNKIDGLVKAYQEWQKLQQQVEKDDISVFANLIGSVVSYDAKLNKLRDDLQKQKGSISALLESGVIGNEEANRATDIANANFDWAKMKMSADYANIYNNAIAMSRKEFEEAALSIEQLLKRLRELELISQEDYVSELDKLSKARREWSETGFLGERGGVGQFISGGYEGLMNYYAERRDKATQKAAQYKEGSEENAKWKSEADHYGKLFDKMSKLSDAAKDVTTAFQTLQSGLDLVTNLFSSLGMEGAANAAGDASGILGGALQGASSLSALGPWGMAAGAALGLVSGIAQTHDKALERQIGKLREDVQQIEANTELIQKARERTLGLDNGNLRRSYTQDYRPVNVISIFSASNASSDMYDYYSKNSVGSGYQQEFQNLMQQRKDYMEILDKQEAKKDKSQSDIEETKAKIAELDDQIRFFSQDLARELFDIDIKGWADQLSDALSSAFENGENMAKSYRDTVTSIMQQLMNRMMKMAILEPMFERLQDKLFGKNGVFNVNDVAGSMGAVTKVISEFFGKGGEGEQTITAATEFMTAFQRGIQNAGLTVFNEASNTLSSGIQGTSEETSNLLASYVNALRQDVSVNRLLFTQFVAQLWPDYVEAFAAHVKTVANIDVNVQVMMEMMRDGRGAMYEEIHSLRSRVDNVVNGIESFTMK